MVSVRLPSDALLQHLPSYLGSSYLGRGVSLHRCSSKVQPLLLTLDEGYLLIAALPDLQRGIAPLGPPMPAQPPLLGLLLPGRRPWPRAWVAPPSCCPNLRHRVAPLGPSCIVPAWCCLPLPRPRTWGNSSWLPPFRHGVLSASAPDLGHGVAPPGLT